MIKKHGMFNRIQYSATSNLFITAAIVTIFALNILLAVLENSYGLGVDLTENKIYTLSAKTRAILAELEEEIVIYTFNTPADQNPRLNMLLGRYGASSDKISVQNMGYSLNKSFYQQFETSEQEITQDSLIICDQAQSRFRILSPEDLFVYDNNYSATAIKAESKITAAIRYIDTGESLHLSFLTGHNETKAANLPALLSQLENLNYEVNTVSLSSDMVTINPKTDILIVASPKSDLTEAEYEVFHAFLEQGGSAVFLMDNAVFSKTQGRLLLYPQKLPYFERLLQTYNLTLNKDLVVGGDPAYIGLRATTIALTPAQHEITAPLLEQGSPVVFSDSSSIRFLDGYSGVTLFPLLATSDTCYAKVVDENFTNLKQTQADQSGSFIMGALAEKNGSHLALFGTSSFISDEALTIAGNSSLIMDTLGYINPGDVSLGVEIKPLRDDAALSLANSRQSGWAIPMLALVPFSIFMLGIYRFVRRKKS